MYYVVVVFTVADAALMFYRHKKKADAAGD